MRQPDDISDDEQAYWEDLIEEAGLFDNHKNPGKNCIHAMPAGQIPMCAKSGMLCDVMKT
jgi:hypothetical protein